MSGPEVGSAWDVRSGHCSGIMRVRIHQPWSVAYPSAFPSADWSARSSPRWCSPWRCWARPLQAHEHLPGPRLSGGQPCLRPAATLR